MNQKGIASPELARNSNISTGTISKIVNANMSITIPMAMNLAAGLGVDVSDILSGLAEKESKNSISKKTEINKSAQLFIGVLSINNKRYTCIKEHTGKIVGTSELEGGLDLTDTTSTGLINLINESIFEALPNENDHNKLKCAKLNLVTQSYEFEDTRNKFVIFAKKNFHDVLLLPDWQITYLATFKNNSGISLVTDKGVSLSYKHKGLLKKLGGWKFPVYDLGGENWLGVETIRHTIEAAEGYIPMSNLARNVLAKFNGKIERITETCFKGTEDADIYSLFSEPLLRNYFTGEDAAKNILEHGFQLIYRLIERVDSILGKQCKIAINGSLADIYQTFFKKERLIISPSDSEKVSLLADITRDFLEQHGIRNI